MAAPLLPVRQNGLAFERIHRLARHAVFTPHHHRRSGSDFGNSPVERRLQEQIVLPSLVHQCGRRITRLNRIDDGRQLFKIELYAFGKIFPLGARSRHAHGDGFTNESYLALRQRWIIGRLEAG